MDRHGWMRHLKNKNKSKIIQAYKHLLTSHEGQVIVRDLARYCCFNQTSFVAQDSHLTAFNEGARDVFLHILEMAHLEPQHLLINDEL